MQLRLLLRFVFVVTVCLTLPSAAVGQLPQLAGKVHPGSNAILAIDVAAVRATPLAQEQGWSQKLEAAYVDRAVYLPPEADALLVASHLVPQEGFQQQWEVAVMAMNEPLSMRAMARAEGGYVEEIRGKQAVWSPSDSYLVALDERTLGVVYPARRQNVARWIEDVTRDGTNRLSPYLQSALARVTPETQIVLAVDLTDAPSPHRVQDALQESETLAKSSVKLEDVVALIQSLQGAAIEVSIDERAHMKAQIEFGQRVGLTEPIAKRLVLEALDNLGIHVGELGEHRFSVAGHSINIEGELSAAGLRRLLSLLEVPTTKFSELEEEVADTSTPSAADMSEYSLTYFKSVVSLLDDLQGDRSKQDTRGGMDGVWMERYARKIDRLPILHVDGDLLEWGSKTAETLRVMASARRHGGLSMGTRQAALRTGDGAYGGSYYGYSYGYRGAGYAGASGASATEKDRSQILRQERNKATATKVEGWRLIENQTAAIRKAMTMRYGIEF